MKLLSNTRPPSADSAAEPSSTSLQNKHSRATRVSLSPRAKKKKKRADGCRVGQVLGLGREVWQNVKATHIAGAQMWLHQKWNVTERLDRRRTNIQNSDLNHTTDECVGDLLQVRPRVVQT